MHKIESNVEPRLRDKNASRLCFAEMCDICLWGNATDLSLLTSLTYDDLQALQGSEARKANEKNIIVNDVLAAYDVLSTTITTKKTERRVDIVLDNAGFELFVDLLLADYFISTGLATTVILHPKSLPWFVSDVVPKDFSDLLNALADPQSLYATQSERGYTASRQTAPLTNSEISDLRCLFERWSTFHAEGRLTMRTNTFWTESSSYWRLPTTAPELYKDLQKSELVIWKGDLNYRKLTGDV